MSKVDECEKEMTNMDVKSGLEGLQLLHKMLNKYGAKVVDEAVK